MRRIFGLASVLAHLLVAGGLVSCASKGSPMYPTPSGGGGELEGSLATTGAQYPHTFANAGTFKYQCTIHPSCLSLQGTIVVVGTGVPIQSRVLGISIMGGSSGPYGSTCAALSLAKDSVQVGDQVVWTNNSPFSHTVTSR